MLFPSEFRVYVYSETTPTCQKVVTCSHWAPDWNHCRSEASSSMRGLAVSPDPCPLPPCDTKVLALVWGVRWKNHSQDLLCLNPNRCEQKCHWSHMPESWAQKEQFWWWYTGQGERQCHTTITHILSILTHRKPGVRSPPSPSHGMHSPRCNFPQV